MKKINRRKKLLIVAGNDRNVGKTEFVCQVIKRFRSNADIYALKVSAIYPNEGMSPSARDDGKSTGRLFEETRKNLNKDTSRMLRAGAKKVFNLRAGNEHLEKGYLEFISKIPDDAVVVFESNSLYEVVKPDLMILIKSEAGKLKPGTLNVLPLYSLEVLSDGQSGFHELAGISLSAEQGWLLIQDKLS